MTATMKAWRWITCQTKAGKTHCLGLNNVFIGPVRGDIVQRNIIEKYTIFYTVSFLKQDYGTELYNSVFGSFILFYGCIFLSECSSDEEIERGKPSKAEEHPKGLIGLVIDMVIIKMNINSRNSYTIVINLSPRKCNKKYFLPSQESMRHLKVRKRARRKNKTKRRQKRKRKRMMGKKHLYKWKKRRKKVPE